MANANINKVIYAGTTLIDLTADTVTPAKQAYGITTSHRFSTYTHIFRSFHLWYFLETNSFTED